MFFVDKFWYKPLTGVGRPLFFYGNATLDSHKLAPSIKLPADKIILRDKLLFFGGAKRCWDLITYMIWLRFLDKNAGWHKLAHLKALTPFVKSFYQQTSKYKTCKKLLKYCWKGRVSSCLRNILYWRLVIPFFSGFDQFDHRPIITRISCIVRIQAIVIIITLVIVIMVCRQILRCEAYSPLLPEKVLSDSLLLLVLCKLQFFLMFYPSHSL